MGIVHNSLHIPDGTRVFFVGDIHGSWELLQKGYKELGITASDIVISVGDLIDRGKDNLKCVEEFTTKPNRFAVIGNHEDMMIKGLTNKAYGDCWLANGGVVTLKEITNGFKDDSTTACRLLSSMFNKTPVLLTVHQSFSNIGVVHGGIPPRYKTTGVDFRNPVWEDIIGDAKESPEYRESLTWDRDAYEYIVEGVMLPQVLGVDWVIHGHTPTRENGYKPLVHGNRIYLDTGGVFNDKLSFVWFENNEPNFYTTGDYDCEQY